MDIEYAGPIYFYKKGKLGQYNLASLEINDDNIVKDMISLGLHPNKSLTIDFPTKIPKDFLHSFILGYFDGDGSICLSKNHPKHASIHICVSHKFGLELQKILRHRWNINSSLFNGNSKIWKLCISGGQQCLKFLNIIYSDAKVFIHRKWEKYQEIKERCRQSDEKKTSKYIGVYFLKCRQKFIAFLKLNGKRHYIGQFNKEINAAKAYNRYVKDNRINKELNSL